MKQDAKLQLEIMLEDTRVKHGHSYSRIAQEICLFMDQYDNPNKKKRNGNNNPDPANEREQMHEWQTRYQSIQSAEQEELEPMQRSLLDLTTSIRDLKQSLTDQECQLDSLLEDYTQIRQAYNDMEKSNLVANAKANANTPKVPTLHKFRPIPVDTRAAVWNANIYLVW